MGESRRGDSFHQTRLGNVLLAGGETQAVESITIEAETGALRVKSMAAGSVASGNHVQVIGCRDGWLLIEDPNAEGGVNRDGVLAYSKTGLALGRAADGSLLVRRTESGVGLMLLLPAAGTERVWMRFEQRKI
jgi:hypothetical protein